MKEFNINFYLHFTVFMLLLQGCAIMCDCDQEPAPTLEVVENNSDILRLDGYYFDSPEDIDYISYCFVLYKNGIALYSFGVDRGDAISGNIEFDNAPEDKQIWYSYFLTDDDILIQGWAPSMKCNGTLITHKGKVLSDTTFELTHRAYDTDEFYKLDKPILYTFVPYENKPDSTNIFIP